MNAKSEHNMYHSRHGKGQRGHSPGHVWRFLPGTETGRLSYERTANNWRQSLWNNPDSSQNVVLVTENNEGRVVFAAVGKLLENEITTLLIWVLAENPSIRYHTLVEILD